jgi:outer membrane lipoprotein SlyB
MGGAAVGGMVGSVIPIIGTGIGAFAGGAIGSIGGNVAGFGAAVRVTRMVVRKTPETLYVSAADNFVLPIREGSGGATPPISDAAAR